VVKWLGAAGGHRKPFRVLVLYQPASLVPSASRISPSGLETRRGERVTWEVFGEWGDGSLVSFLSWGWAWDWRSRMEGMNGLQWLALGHTTDVLVY
jgi:hypothetical protein